MKKKIKKYFYIAMFTLLGILASLVVHAGVEIAVIDLLTTDFERYNLGFSWSSWLTIHLVWSVLISVIFTIMGFWQGKYWWGKIYE